MGGESTKREWKENEPGQRGVEKQEVYVIPNQDLRRGECISDLNSEQKDLSSRTGKSKDSQHSGDLMLIELPGEERVNGKEINSRGSPGSRASVEHKTTKRIPLSDYTNTPRIVI